MIDFGKTVPLADNITIDHRSTWVEGNHEDGYLLGISSLIDIFEDIVSEKQHISKSVGDLKDVATDISKTSVDCSLTENKDQSKNSNSESVSASDKNSENSHQSDNSDSTSRDTVSKKSLKESHC